MKGIINSDTGKKDHVKSMFDSIAWRYDFLNHFLSAGIDRSWRKKAIAVIKRHKTNPEILDVATGTADLALTALRLEPKKITGIDISEKMLDIGKEKIRKLGLENRIELLYGDSENIPFSENSFDVSMAAFGVRNFADPVKGLKEMNRVLRPDGMIMVLEFSRPGNLVFKSVYNFYFRRMLPFFGHMFSKDKKAYSYLPESVMKFPDNEEFMGMLTEAGFSGVWQKRLTGGIASIYTGFKTGKQ
jgi:demethylmenaquinone methyltransferase/2-methoxy-6-polyprenyl-1,4-benzoquinol methylase